MTLHLLPPTPTAQAEEGVPRRRPARVRRAVGGLFLFTGGVHVGIVAAGTEYYRPFADAALLDVVRERWSDVFMANPVAWGLAVAAGEVTIGVLLLRGGRWARAGWVGAIGFHLALMLFGWGFWLWSVPALAVVVPAAVADWRSRSMTPAA